jgi:hypothetical protein
MQQSKPKMTIIYAAKSNQIWEGQRFTIGDKISAADYEKLPDEKKEHFRKVEMGLRDFVENLLDRTDELEAKVSALEKHISKTSTPNK